MLAVILARWPVAAIAATQSLAISKLAGSLHIDKTRGKLIIGSILVEEHIYIKIAMTGIDGVTDSGIHRLQPRGWHPTIIHHFDDGTERTFGDNSLLLILHIVEMQLVLTVPSTQGAQSVSISYPKAVVARTSLKLFFGWIELGIIDNQSLVNLAIEVDGLTIVEIDTHGNQLALKADAMRMHIVIHILGLLVERDAAQIDVLLVLCQLLVLARQAKFGKGTGRILCLLALLIELHLIGLGLLLAKVNQEAEFIVDAIAIGVVELGRNLLAIHLNHGTLNSTNGS